MPSKQSQTHRTREYCWTKKGQSRVAIVIQESVKKNKKLGIHPDSLRELAHTAGLPNHISLRNYAAGGVRQPNKDDARILRLIAPYIYQIKSLQRDANGEIIQIELSSDTYVDSWEALAELGEAVGDRYEISQTATQGFKTLGEAVRQLMRVKRLTPAQVANASIPIRDLMDLVDDSYVPSAEELRLLSRILDYSHEDFLKIRATQYGLLHQNRGVSVDKSRFKSVAEVFQAFLEHQRSIDERWNQIEYVASQFPPIFEMGVSRIEQILAGDRCQPQELNFLEDIFTRLWTPWDYIELAALNPPDVSIGNGQNNHTSNNSANP